MCTQILIRQCYFEYITALWRLKWSVWNVNVQKQFLTLHYFSSLTPLRLNCRLFSLSGSCDAISLKSRKMSWNVSSSPDSEKTNGSSDQDQFFKNLFITADLVWKHLLTCCSEGSFWISHLFVHPRHPQSETPTIDDQGWGQYGRQLGALMKTIWG